MTEGNPPAIDDRMFQRRRLAVLTGVLLVVLALAPLLAPPGDDEAPVEVAAGAGDQRVRIAGIGSPTAVRELLSETTTTLVEASGAATGSTTAAAPTATTAAAPTTTAVSRAADADADADADGDASPTTTTAAPTTSSARVADEPTTTAEPPTPPAPTTTPPTTAAPQPTTTTTAGSAPAATSEDGYARDDPRGTQVWHDLAQCESGGNWSIDTGNGYYGGLQFSLATWESVGGTGYPHEHPVATQMEMGRRLQARQGWGAWPHCSEELGLH